MRINSGINTDILTGKMIFRDDRRDSTTLLGQVQLHMTGQDAPADQHSALASTGELRKALKLPWSCRRNRLVINRTCGRLYIAALFHPAARPCINNTQRLHFKQMLCRVWLQTGQLYAVFSCTYHSTHRSNFDITLYRREYTISRTAIIIQIWQQ